jgi:hypothetical protein
VKWFLLWALGSTGVIIVALCIVFLFLRGRIRRHHRVDTKVQTGAPITWLVDPRSPARLHRRLARVGTAVDAVIADHQAKRRMPALTRRPEPTPLASTATDLKSRAVAADRQLARIASLAPTARRGALVELSRQVSDLEVAATRLAALSASSLTPSTLQHHLDDNVAGQVERLVEAQRELDDLDATSGLRPASPNPLSSALAPVPAPEAPSSQVPHTAPAPPPRPAPIEPTPTHG